MLNIEGLSVNYGYISALRNISLTVEENEIVSLIGSNGAGKTTTLMSVSGLVPKRAGCIRFEGEDITKASAHGLSLIHISSDVQFVLGEESLWKYRIR